MASIRSGLFRRWSLRDECGPEGASNRLPPLCPKRKAAILIEPTISFEAMIFSVDQGTNEITPIRAEAFAALDVLERRDFQEWVIDNPEILGEDLLVVQSEYANFEKTSDRLDVLALDEEGKLVVVELKRDEADNTTDLQAIKYASYCATLTAEEIQKEYRTFWNGRGDDLSPEEVGQHFAEFLDESIDEEIPVTEEGWAAFELDDRPRILLAAGSFDIQVTAPVMWLIEEHDLDITCITMHAYRHEGELLLHSRQVIPIQEAEEYMTQRRAKQEQKSSSQRRTRAIEVLLERGVLVPGDIVTVPSEKRPSTEYVEEQSERFWKAKVTGKRGRSDNFRWLHDDQEYSATGLAKTILESVTGERPNPLNGYKYLCHPEFNSRTLSDLRNSRVKAPERRS